MQTHRATVESGLGDLAQWMQKYATAYESAVGQALVPGSLNVRLSEAWSVPPGDGVRLESEDVGRGVTLVACIIEGTEAWVIRTDRNDAGKGRHPRNVVEIVAPVHLRSVLGLSDGDVVTLQLP